MRLKQLLKTQGEEFKYDTSSLQKKKVCTIVNIGLLITNLKFFIL